MNCPTCGAGGYSKSAKDTDSLNGLVKSATAPGSRLKSLRSSRTRPDAIGGKGGMTRGGRFAKT